MMANKRERSINWEQDEKQLLREIIKPYRDIISNKDLSTNTNKTKLNAWKEITEKFNTANIRKRDKRQLMNQWKCFKIASKKEMSQYRLELNKTGGGPKPPSPSPETLELIELIPQEFEVDTNEFDCDGVQDIAHSSVIHIFENDAEINDKDSKLNDNEEEIIDAKKVTSKPFTTPKRSVNKTLLKKEKEVFNFGVSSYTDMQKFRILENERQQKEHELRMKNATEIHKQVMENLKLQNEILLKTLESLNNKGFKKLKCFY